ncbi:TatD family hydrolase [Patescibacteria group bacterium]|nr:TatD family hydrolase [Patescibacteria group bacterium]MBU1758410.1 TatD family hydrolase [Patescibacteria group bacterium]
MTKENISSKIKELRDLIENNRQYVVAVGECGIDLHFTDTPENFSIQKELFIAQCELARELQLPLMVHSRDAFDQTMDVLKNYQDLVVYFHCR